MENIGEKQRRDYSVWRKVEVKIEMKSRAGEQGEDILCSDSASDYVWLFASTEEVYNEFYPLLKCLLYYVLLAVACKVEVSVK